MKILICIDDTDNIDSRGTGEIASLIAEEIEAHGWGKAGGVTRHQLLVHPDIPYTSHNSSMCFPVELEEGYYPQVVEVCTNFLARESAPGSDPGLCIIKPDERPAWPELIAFGRQAKQQVLTKTAAYQLAEELDIHLSEHGGTGQGVIGALAGVGLRLTGNDGRFKGKHQIKAENQVARVAEICTQAQIDLVKTTDGEVLSANEQIFLGEKVKTVFLEGKSVLLVCPLEENLHGARWQTCPMQFLKQY